MSCARTRTRAQAFGVKCDPHKLTLRAARRHRSASAAVSRGSPLPRRRAASAAVFPVFTSPCVVVCTHAGVRRQVRSSMASEALILQALRRHPPRGDPRRRRCCRRRALHDNERHGKRARPCCSAAREVRPPSSAARAAAGARCRRALPARAARRTAPFVDDELDRRAVNVATHGALRSFFLVFFN